MITVFYFARLKEAVRYQSETLEFSAKTATISDLKAYLAGRGEVWAQQFAGHAALRAAINHALVQDDASITDGDEVAFFPPVTGG